MKGINPLGILILVAVAIIVIAFGSNLVFTGSLIGAERIIDNFTEIRSCNINATTHNSCDIGETNIRFRSGFFQSTVTSGAISVSGIGSIDNLVVASKVSSHLRPDAGSSEIYDIGDIGRRWRELHTVNITIPENETIFMGIDSVKNISSNETCIHLIGKSGGKLSVC